MKNFVLIESRIADRVDTSLVPFDISQSDDLTGHLSQIFTRFEEEQFCVVALSSATWRQIRHSVLALSHDNCHHSFLVLEDNEEEPLDYSDLSDVIDYRDGSISGREFSFLVKKALSDMNVRQDMEMMQEEYLAKLLDTRQDQEDLINIGRSLSLEKDQDKLLRLILFLSKKITGADAGSIYLVEREEDEEPLLRFRYSHTFSREIPLEEFTIPLNKKSIAGYVAVTGEVLNIPDVYRLPEGTPFSFNSSFDKNNSYISRSMLVVPMRNHEDEVIGVIQLINSKEDLSKTSEYESIAFGLVLESDDDFDRYVVTFDEKYDTLMEAVAGQAAIAIENNRLIKQIQRQFEEFVKASVTAIESRDPATSGHSFRVAEICTAVAKAIHEETEGPLADVTFSDNEMKELEYAALLHDYGKVYVDLSIFQKQKKLFPHDLDNLILRLNYLYRYMELQYLQKRSLIMKERDGAPEELDALDQEKKNLLEEIRNVRVDVERLNEPVMLDEDPAEKIDQIYQKIHNLECYDISGNPVEILNEHDRINLSIRRGSLNDEERNEIESHVVHTYNFVSRIPWPPEYKNIPEIARNHHEKLDGTGYPRKLKGKEEVPLQSRIMAIADIFDALAASDRPYKKAMPVEKVVSILQEEAERGILDADVVDVFVRHRIHETIDLSSRSENA